MFCVENVFLQGGFNEVEEISFGDLPTLKDSLNMLFWGFMFQGAMANNIWH